MTSHNGRPHLIGSILAIDGAIAPYLERVQLRQGEVLVRKDEPITHAYFPRDCVISRVVPIDEERCLAVGLIGSEGFIGLPLLFGINTGNANVMVQIPGDAIRMRTKDFLERIVERRGEPYRMLLRYANLFISQSAQFVACISLHSFEQRLATWILMTLDSVDERELPLTHEFMSSILGVRRPTVSLTAHALRERGLIEYSRGKLRVIDRAGLERTACECYAAVRGFDGRDISQAIAM